MAATNTPITAQQAPAQMDQSLNDMVREYLDQNNMMAIRAANARIEVSQLKQACEALRSENKDLKERIERLEKSESKKG